MTTNVDIDELRRLRRDFKAQAALYPDLALTRYSMDQRLITPKMELKSPEHIISLWQYLGTTSAAQAPDLLRSTYPSKYGLLGAALSLFAIIHGEKLDLFKRMAARAGSLTLVSDVVETQLTASLMDRFDVPAVLGKNVFVFNSNPLAEWLNVVFFCLAAVQPKRFGPLTLPVDPFAASLTACDSLLQALEEPPSVSEQDTRAARHGNQRTRWDETWHRLRDWTNGQGPSERLAAQILLSDGYQNLDPSHPLGGPDGGRDAACVKDGEAWVMAVYFPRGQQKFATIKKKFMHDLRGAKKRAAALAFVTNQELTNADKERLLSAARPTRAELFHLEKITAILDKPVMAPVRRQFLFID